MSIIYHYAVWVVLFSSLGASFALGQLPAAGERVLHRQQLPDGGEVRVVQGPMVPTDALKPVLPLNISVNTRNRLSGMFCLSVQFRAEGQPPLILWSRIWQLYGNEEYDQFHVLDFQISPKHDRLVFSMTVPGITLCLFQIGFKDISSAYFVPKTHEWSQRQYVPPGVQLSAEFSYDANDDVFKLEVIDPDDMLTVHTFYEQVKGEWKFNYIRQEIVKPKK